MASNSDARALSLLAVLACVFGLVHTASGIITLLSAISIGTLVLGGSRLALGLLLVPAGVGIGYRKPWGRWLGIGCFAGLAIVQVLPLLSGSEIAVPLAGIFLWVGSSLYLLLSGEVFENGDDDSRVLTEDTNPHEFIR
ncbi:hypothetical protein [Haloarcula nitratireducens]|uniref:Uncharacterized protein n=1 Tax=Haloarcula nitratireducens TaxID=2487749 RepID=A0AAW4PBN0_9EURY|nr:hypothetical protein [Halomicroarcula nitratireducens]MBX0295075.1 hypothetical protein [Halomicroarcula nitratireducens]